MGATKRPFLKPLKIIEWEGHLKVADASGAWLFEMSRDKAEELIKAVNHFEEMREVLKDERLSPPCDGASREDTYHWFADFESWRNEARALLKRAKGE